MENASKALIIAGAILISIVLVSVGVIVVNSLNPNDAVATMTEQEIKAFNAKFESSTGTNKSGTVVRTLISTIITNNSTYSNDTSKQIKVILDNTVSNGVSTGNDGVADSTNLTSIKNGIATGTRYDVTPAYDQDSGLMKSITIKKHTNS